MTTQHSKNATQSIASSMASVTALRKPDQTVISWPDVTQTTTVRWTTPRIEVVVDVAPGEDITQALLAAARDEIALYVPVNVDEFDVDLA